MVHSLLGLCGCDAKEENVDCMQTELERNNINRFYFKTEFNVLE